MASNTDELPRCPKCGGRVRSRNGNKPHPRTGEPRQGYVCVNGHAWIVGADFSARFKADPARRRPPVCPVVEDGVVCGRERIWEVRKATATRPASIRGLCRVHGYRVLSAAEKKALETGNPYPERRAWSPKLIKKVKA